MIGIIHGKTIELSEEPGLADGQQVEIIVRAAKPRTSEPWGEGLRPCAVALVDVPGLDGDMDAILKERNSPRAQQFVRSARLSQRGFLGFLGFLKPWPAHFFALCMAIATVSCLAGCEAPGTQPRFVVGEKVTFVDFTGNTYEGVVRQYDRSRGCLIAYRDDRFFDSREDWIYEDRVTSLTPRAGLKRPIDFTPLYRAMGAACGSIGTISLLVFFAVRSVKRRSRASTQGNPFNL